MMRMLKLLGGRVVFALGVVTLPCAPAFGQDPAPRPAAEAGDAFQRRVLPFVERYCVDCHSTDYNEGKIVLDRFPDQAAAVADDTTWFRVLKAIEGRLMPPADMPQPTAEELDGAIAWIEDDYLAAQCGGEARPGPVVIRRLNRQEYDNTIRDLLGLGLPLADAFPADEIGFGFDNVGSALSISPVHIEKYLDAAELALDAAIALPDAEGFPPIELIGLRTYPLPPDKPVEFEHSLKPGRYLADFSLVRVGVAESVPPPRMLIGLGQDRRAVDAARVQDETVVYRFWINVAAGDKTVHVALAPGQAQRKEVARPTEVTANVSGDQRYGNNRGLHVDSLVVHGPVPLDADRLPEAHRRLLSQDPGYGDEARAACAREVIGRFAERAFRRPVPTEEVDHLLEVFRLAQTRGESYERSVQIALTAILASPRFLFLVEPEESGEDRPLDDFELASRLSYFLWSSMPDDELFREAREGTLRTNLRRQVGRMLDDPKSDAFVANFTGQWLQLRRLAGATPDANLFPTFDDALRASMRRETELYFAHVLREDRSVLELLDSDYTFVNEALARHYGIADVAGDEFRRVTLSDRLRGGIVTQASVLTLTSNPNRTSPVKRGQWILQQLLGTPPPPPPPDVPKLDESETAADAASLRERLEVHRANPACASCHSQMDPLGFALENFDAVGRYRTRDGEFPIDPSGELAGGVKLSGVGDLKRVLAGSGSKKFTRSFVENMLTYALGRGLEPADYCTVEAIRKRLVAEDFRIRGVIVGIVESEAFQHRGSAD
jgi:hypothetical protein